MDVLKVDNIGFLENIRIDLGMVMLVRVSNCIFMRVNLNVGRYVD